MRPTARTIVQLALAGLLLFGALLGAGSVQAQSAGTLIAGPFTVTLPSSSLFAFSQSFNVPPPLAQSYLLRVELGTPNSLTTLSVRLNNVQVLSLSDFAGGVTRVDKVVTLLLSDTLALQLAGATGTKITVTVFTVVMPKPVGLSPNPLALNAGTSGTLTATLSPTPTATGTLNVTSSNPQAATVPASVSFSSGQASVAILVSARGGGSATITASANGGQASATVNVKAEAQVYYIHPDHLNTPRFIADQTQKIVWRWDQQEPFGNTPPNDDPDGDGVKFDFPLRFPGQYFDRETNLAYNWMRDYDSSISRYVQSDPIGLRGGLNTYAYVNSNPIRSVDPRGLLACELRCALDYTRLILGCVWERELCTGNCEDRLNFPSPLWRQCMQDCDKKFEACRKPYLECLSSCKC